MVQIPHPLRMGIKFSSPWKTLIIKFSPPWDGKGVKSPRYARGVGMLKLRFDRYITRKSYLIFSSRTLFNYHNSSVIDPTRAVNILRRKHDIGAKADTNIVHLDDNLSQSKAFYFG